MDLDNPADERGVIRMAESRTGDFREISQDMCETLKDITGRKNDALVKIRRDGTYDVFEVERKKRRPPKKKQTESE
ncbi:hypothetical protein RCJ22_03625 [Vibrio sp. FNV 38]|nr:hypothetical protein [Vibrio sp. FNV 38]